MLELSAVSLGGARQYVLIRGFHQNGPMILFLHGGPGMPAMYLAHDFQRPLEHHFTVVQWDRRGAGKSYGARFPVESLTVRRTIDDLIELSRLLRARFHPERLYLVAHSWGTYLGLQALHEHPELFDGYVGMGQLVPDSARLHREQRRCVLREARALADSSVYRRLAARYEGDSTRVRESDLFAAHSELYGSTSYWPLIWSGLRAPEYNFLDAMHIGRGASFVAAHMRDDVPSDWMRERPRLERPLFFFLGRHDCTTPSDLAAEWLDTIEAPLEGTVWFERSAHFPFWEEPRRFAEAMVRVDSLVDAAADSLRRHGAPLDSVPLPRVGEKRSPL